MRRKISDSVVVITGASSGIGRATALAFAEHGAAVALAARNQLALGEVARECERLGGHALSFPTDVTDEAAVRELAEAAKLRFGRVDVWVNNAAVSLFGRIDEAPCDAYRRVIETNIMGYVHGARAAVGLFREQGGGTLINVSSVNGVVAAPYVSAYVTSKYAVIGLGNSLRQELMDIPDIKICTVLPASIDTPIFQHAANATGRAVKPLSPIYDVGKVAAAILSLVERPRREIVVGNAGRILIGLYRLAPGFIERLMKYNVERDHFQKKTAPPSDGNLFIPREDRLTGDWKPGSTPAWLAGTASLALLCVAFLAPMPRPEKTHSESVEAA